jgi:hypothetical protein
VDAVQLVLPGLQLLSEELWHDAHEKSRPQALARDEDISVMHVFVDEDESAADHIWRLSSQEKENPASSWPPRASPLLWPVVFYNLVGSLVLLCRSRNGSEQRSDACGQRHGQRAPECDAYCPHRHACSTGACSQPA